MSCVFCGHPSALPGNACTDRNACRERFVQSKPPYHPQSSTGAVHDQAEKMKRDVQNVIGLGMRWLMGESLLEAVDSEHGTQLAPMANMAVKKIDEVRSEVERTIAARDANVAAREQVTEEARKYLRPEASNASPGECPACKGVGATRVMLDGKPHAQLCNACEGTGTMQVGNCEACKGNGAILEYPEINGYSHPVPRPCKACNATGRKQP